MGPSRHAIALAPPLNEIMARRSCRPRQAPASSSLTRALAHGRSYPFQSRIRFFAAARQYAIYAGGSEQLVQPEGFDFSTFIEEKTASEGASLAPKSCDALVVLSPNPKTVVEQVAPNAGSRTILSDQRSGVAAQLGLSAPVCKTSRPRRCALLVRAGVCSSAVAACAPRSLLVRAGMCFFVSAGVHSESTPASNLRRRALRFYSCIHSSSALACAQTTSAAART
jgi:hypothetical protein